MKLKKIPGTCKFLIALSLILAVLTMASSFYMPKSRKVKVVVIDPGHGGKDPGCSGISHKEKDVSLAVALKLGKYIEEYMKDVKVIYTRKTDVFVELEDRAKIANDNNADLFISIHCNAAGKPVMIKDKKTGKLRAKTFKNSKGKLIVVETTNPVPYGSETYVMGLKNEEGKMKVAQRENSVILLEENYESKYQGFDPNSEESYIIMSNYTSGYVIQSAGLALKIQEEYSKRAGRVDKGVHRQSIWVLWRTSMPSVLTEIGYLTNPQEEKFLGSEKGQEYMAACLFRALRKYKDEQEGVKKEYNDAIENQKKLEKEVHVTVKETEAVEAEDEPEKKDSAKAGTRVAHEESESKYTELITIADLSFKNKNYSDAKILYEKALKIRNQKDEYASGKLAELAAIQKKEEDEKIAKDEEEKNQPIEFKVQFASNDKEVNAKIKYPDVKDVWFYKAGSVYKYTSGSFASFEEASLHQAKLKESGYKDCFVAAFRNGIRMNISEAKTLTAKAE